MVHILNANESRNQLIARLQEPLDVLVLGGGVNGLATAWDCARRGLRVAIIDKGDWGSGTSAWSSRMIHGGLKYLEHLELGLVRESLRDREWLMQKVPHLVKALPVMVPFYKRNKHSKLILRLGMLVYDTLSLVKSLPRHQIFSAAETTRKVPALDTAGLKGSGVYYDAQVEHSERLCIEVLLAAHRNGAVTVNHISAESLLMEGPRVVGARLRDQITQGEMEVRAAVTVNATGPWIDDLLRDTPLGSQRLNGGTKGTHLIIRRFPGAPEIECVYYEAQSDGRQVLVIPWNGMLLIGSTDKRFDGDLDRVAPDDEEIEYILAETNVAFPSAKLTRESIVYAYTGVRPLPYKAEGAEGTITRKHIVKDHAPDHEGIITLIGGKLTTFRTLGEHAADAVCRKLKVAGRSSTRSDTFTGSTVSPGEMQRWFERNDSGFDPSTVSRLISLYGANAKHIAELAAEAPSMLEPVVPKSTLIRAEVVHAIRHEQGWRLADVLARRTLVGWQEDLAIPLAPVVAEIMAQELAWDEARINDEICHYKWYLERLTRTEGGEVLSAVPTRD